MSNEGLSKSGPGRMHETMAGYVERGRVSGNIHRDFWTSVYQTLDG